MANWLERRSLLVLACLSVAVALSSLPSGGSEAAAVQQQPSGSGGVNFTIGVVGAVWCKNCRYAGYVKSKNVSPLPNAAALLRCRRGEKAMSVWGATDASGRFKIQAAGQAAVPFASKDCVVYVPRSPRGRACGVAVQPRRNKGSPLKFQEYVALTDGLQALYTAGNFVFGPRDPAKC